MSLDVDLQSLSLKELFDGSAGALHIPDYQRTYCWLPENVFKLLLLNNGPRKRFAYSISSMYIDYLESLHCCLI